MQDDQNGQKTMVLTSAEETDLFYTITKYFFCSEQPSLTADVNTIILQVYTYLICLQSWVWFKISYQKLLWETARYVVSPNYFFVTIFLASVTY
jgi:hypothetical protein